METPENITENLTTPALRLAEAGLKHTFFRTEILVEALSHSSFANEKWDGAAARKITADNERLEYLGDAVIGLVVAERLMQLFPTAQEGKLSRWRSNLVSRKALAELAAALGMGDWVLLGRGERNTGGAEKKSILSGVFEAVVGALYLDAGLEKTREFLLGAYEPLFKEIDGEDGNRKHFDQKTFLQEFTQSKFRATPIYHLVDSWGLEHEKTFKVEIEIDGKLVAQGEGKSKKEAEQVAAIRALEEFGF